MSGDYTDRVKGRAKLLASLFGYLGVGDVLVSPPESSTFHATPIEQVAQDFGEPSLSELPVYDIGGAVEPGLGPEYLAGQGRKIGEPSQAVSSRQLTRAPAWLIAIRNAEIRRIQAYRANVARMRRRRRG